MLIIKRKLLDYHCPSLGRQVTHYALIAQLPKKKLLLSHPNLFLYDTTRSSEKTSSRYSSVISMFYKFLSTEEKFKDLDPSQYHAVVDNLDLKRWQLARQIARVAKQSLKPTSETIFEDAKIVLVFCHWLNLKGYRTNVKVEIKTHTANFKRNSLLAYVQAKARTSIRAKNIQALDKEARQRQRRTLITASEIKTYLQAFTDPVYSVMFKLALGTAMRPMDLCTVPYLGNGANAHIMPYSEMDQEPTLFNFTVYGSKGNKTRTIKIHRDDLRVLDEQYIQPYYDERRKKYKKRFGEDCPLDILFLNAQGLPVTPEKISSRGNAAKDKAVAKDKTFRASLNFYESRHWWPTMFLISYFKEDLLTSSADVLWAACGEALVQQMGHEDVSTTFAHYIDMGRVVMMANKGKMTELITQAHSSVHSFIDTVTTGNLILD